MRSMILILAVAGAALAPSVGFARTAHGHGYGANAPYQGEQSRSSPIDSGYGPPSNWNEIEQSGCNTSGCG